RAARPVGAVVREVRTLPDWGSLIAFANTGANLPAGVTVERAEPGPIALPSGVELPVTSENADEGVGTLRRSSPVRYVASSESGGFAVLPEPFDPTWTAGAGKARAGAAGETIVPVPPSRETAVRFAFWGRV